MEDEMKQTFTLTDQELLWAVLEYLINRGLLVQSLNYTLRITGAVPPETCFVVTREYTATSEPSTVSLPEEVSRMINSICPSCKKEECKVRNNKARQKMFAVLKGCPFFEESKKEKGSRFIRPDVEEKGE